MVPYILRSQVQSLCREVSTNRGRVCVCVSVCVCACACVCVCVCVCVCGHDGGRVDAATPTHAMLSLLYRAVTATQGTLVYARVDILCDMQGQLYLGELQLIEPIIFLEFQLEATKKFAEAILENSSGL